MNQLIHKPPRLLQRVLTTVATLAIAFVAFVPGSSQAEIYSVRPMQLYQNPTTQLSQYQSRLSKFVTGPIPGGTFDPLLFKVYQDYQLRGESSLITSQPTAKWFASWPANGDLTQVRTEVANYVGAAWGMAQVPVLVIYNIYKRDCLSASAGGPPSGNADAPTSNANEGTADSDYMQYIFQFQLGLQDAQTHAQIGMPVIILLEPDSLGLQSTATIGGAAQKGGPACADYSQQYNDPASKPQPVVFNNSMRNYILHQAVRILSNAACYDGTSTCASYDSWVKVYLDGTHSNWGGWPSVAGYDSNNNPVAGGYLVDALIAAGIQDAAGIFTNVSNYQVLGDPTSSDQHNGELAYGKWLLARVKAKINLTYQGRPVWGFRGNCGNAGGFCGTIPEKGQVIDVARSGAAMNLSSDNDQGNGWPGWCDNMHAQLGQPPTLYPNDITGAPWVDALLWVKPAGETDGCFGNGLTNHSVARGVPNQAAPEAVRAGTLDLYASCMLIAGIQGVDPQGKPVLNDCHTFGNYAYSPSSHPTGLRIAKTTSVAAGNAYDSVLLEWNPVPGACSYQVWSRPGTSGAFLLIYVVSSTDANGPASSALISSSNADVWFKGDSVQFGVRAFNCSDLQLSKLSLRVTSHDFTQ